jgi:tetratricopeptide (TPR) repeat protein
MYQVVVDNKSSSTTQQAEALTNQSIIKRGQILYMQDAIDLSKRAVDTDSNYAPALAAYGFNLGINGKFGEGVNFLKKSLEVNPRISQNYYYLGVLYRSVGDLNSAVDYQEKGYDSIDKDNTILDPTTKNKLKGNMAYDLAKTYDTLGKENQVLSLLQEAVRLNPKLVQTLKNDYKNKKQFQSLATNANFRLLVQ